MRDRDAFFLQKVPTPVRDPAKSVGIKDDPRLPYYTKVVEYPNIYAMDHLKWGGSYGHTFTPSLPEEHARLDGIVSRNLNDKILDN